MWVGKTVQLLAIALVTTSAVSQPHHDKTIVQAPAVEGRGGPISDQDRIYTGDQSSNTITVINPKSREVLGTISLGESRLSDNLNPQYVDAVNSHGLGFSPDGRYIVSLSVTSNTATVIRTADNDIVSQTFVDRNSHEAFFAHDNRHVWIGTRGVDRIDIIDGLQGGIVDTVDSWGGPSKVLFSPDGKTAYANHIRSAALSVIDVESRRVTHNITGLADVFSSDMMLSADGKAIWVAHKMAGKVTIIDLATHDIVGVLDTGSETNHPNFAIINGTTHGFVTVAATNETKMYRQAESHVMPVYVGSIPSSGVEPHGLWPSPDNTHMYILNEHSDTVDIVDLTALPAPRIADTVTVGQEGQALIYVASAVPEGQNDTQNLGTQGLLPKHGPLNKIVTMTGDSTNNMTKSSALVTVRQQVGLDMVQVIGRDLRLGTTYTLSGSCKECGGGVSIPLVDFRATTPTMDGCGTASQVLAFFRFMGVYDMDTLKLTAALDVDRQ